MKRTDVTYGQLDKVLRSLGFLCQPFEKKPPGRIYHHPKSGAMIMLPSFPDSERVFAYHLVTVQGELESFGIADPIALADQFQKAG